MDRAVFEQGLREQGYGDVVDRQVQANNINPEHSHEFDARLLILDGTMTIVRDGAPHTYRAGETFEMSAGTMHEEQAGPEGARYLAGRRYK